MDPEGLRADYWKLAAAGAEVMRAWDNWLMQGGDMEAEKTLAAAMDLLAKEINGPDNRGLAS